MMGRRKNKYNLFVSELVINEAKAGNREAADRRIAELKNIPILKIDKKIQDLAEHLIKDKGVPDKADADALHIAIACIHSMDYLMTWNCRHIDNAATKPRIRIICTENGYVCPEICTPLELLTEE